MGRYPGILITLEGTEGAGKSTLIREISARLRKRQLRFIVTREPGGSPLSEKIRDLILGSGMAPWTELFLYEAARAEHVEKTIIPALKKGWIVVCDRFTDSSLAYQAHARKLPWKEVKNLNHLATKGIKPDLTVLLDINPALGLKRATVKSRFEKEGVLFQKTVRRGFLKARAENPGRWLRLDVHKNKPNELAEKVFKKIEKKLLRVIHGKYS